MTSALMSYFMLEHDVRDSFLMLSAEQSKAAMF